MVCEVLCRNWSCLRHTDVLFGCAHSVLVQRAADINLQDLAGVKTLGITAGASAPEVLVKEVIDTLSEHFKITLSEHVETEEKVSFPLPASLRE